MSGEKEVPEQRKIRHWTQRFEGHLEQKFKEHLQQSLPKRAALFCLACIIASAMMRLSGATSTSHSWIATLLLLPIPVMVVGLLIISLAAWKGVLHKSIDLEYTVIGVIAVCMVFVPLNDPWRLALLQGEDPYEYWEVNHFEDTRLFAAMDGVVTVTLIFVPLRSSLNWLIPLAGAVSWILTTAWLGSPAGYITEWKSTSPLHSSILLVMLFWFAWKGRSAAEATERRLFCDLIAASAVAEEERQRTEEEKKRTVQERVLRFDAERTLDQVQGTWKQTAAGCSRSLDNQKIKYQDPSDMESSRRAIPLHCFLTDTSFILHENPNKPGHFVRSGGADVRPGMQLLVLDEGRLTLSEVQMVHHLEPPTKTQFAWYEMTCTTGEETTTFVVTNNLLMSTPAGVTQEIPSKVALEEPLKGAKFMDDSRIALEDTEDTDAFLDVPLHQMTCVDIELEGKAQSALPKEAFALQLADSRHALLVGSTQGSSSKMWLLAVSSFVGHRGKGSESSVMSQSIDIMSNSAASCGKFSLRSIPE